jgi:hypothetical protein
MKAYRKLISQVVLASAVEDERLYNFLRKCWARGLEEENYRNRKELVEIWEIVKESSQQVGKVVEMMMSIVEVLLGRREELEVREDRQELLYKLLEKWSKQGETTKEMLESMSGLSREEKISTKAMRIMCEMLFTESPIEENVLEEIEEVTEKEEEVVESEVMRSILTLPNWRWIIERLMRGKNGREGRKVEEEPSVESTMEEEQSDDGRGYMMGEEEQSDDGRVVMMEEEEQNDRSEDTMAEEVGRENRTTMTEEEVGRENRIQVEESMNEGEVGGDSRTEVMMEGEEESSGTMEEGIQLVEAYPHEIDIESIKSILKERVRGKEEAEEYVQKWRIMKEKYENITKLWKMEATMLDMMRLTEEWNEKDVSGYLRAIGGLCNKMNDREQRTYFGSKETFERIKRIIDRHQRYVRDDEENRRREEGDNERREIREEELEEILKTRYRQRRTGSKGEMKDSTEKAGWKAFAWSVRQTWGRLKREIPECNRLWEVQRVVDYIMTNRKKERSWNAKSSNTYLSHVSSLFGLLTQAEQEKYFGSVETYEDCMMRVQEASHVTKEIQNEVYEEQELTEEEREQWIEWEELVSRVKRYISKNPPPDGITNDQQYRLVRRLFIGHIMIEHPPRRLEIFKIKTRKESEGDNYMEEERIVLNDYKTQTVYGQYKMGLSEESKGLLKKLIKRQEERNAQYALGGNGETSGTTVMKEAFETMCGKTIKL